MYLFLKITKMQIEPQWIALFSVVTILLFLVSITFDSSRSRFQCGSFVTKIYKFLITAQHYNTEALSSFVNKNRSCDNGGE